MDQIREAAAELINSIMKTMYHSPAVLSYLRNNKGEVAHPISCHSWEIGVQCH